MKIDPVYLLAPEPKPPAVPTRRAFLLAGVAGFAGIGAGYVLSAATSTATTETPSTAQGADEATERIRWAEDLASHGVDEILDNLPAFLGVVHEANALRSDRVVLWSGVRKAAEAIVNRGAMPLRASKAKAILAISALRPEDSTLRELRPFLLRISIR